MEQAAHGCWRYLSCAVHVGHPCSETESKGCAYHNIQTVDGRL